MKLSGRNFGMEKSRHGSRGVSVKNRPSDMFEIHLLIPGLNGDPVNTWSYGDICWPRDLLPGALSSPVRILSFGYNPSRRSNVYPDIEDVVLHLISELERVRPVKKKSRPLIAVAYSLGGIGLKKGLLYASVASLNKFRKALILCSDTPSLRRIPAALSGIVFLAAPHRESALADTANRLVRQLRIRLLRNFISALKKILVELLSCFDDVVVDKDSALLRIPSEGALGVYTNHRDICRYRDSYNPIFRDVTRHLQQLVDLGPQQISARVFVPFEVTPHFVGRQGYLQEIHNTFNGSNNRQVIALSGEGGTGKTEISLKYAREKPRWGLNGQIEMRDPLGSYVPPDLVRLINGPNFHIAPRGLQSCSLIASDEMFEDGRNPGNKNTIVLHPLAYSYVREALPPKKILENAIHALSLVVHAYPVAQAGLDQSPSRSVFPRVRQCSLNCEYLAGENLDLIKAIEKVDTRVDEESTFAEMTAEMFMEAARRYGEGFSHLDDTLLHWIKTLIKPSERTGLHPRLWCTRLPLEFYNKGKFTDGCEATATFLQDTNFGPRGSVTNNDHAPVGFLHQVSVEYLTRDDSLSDREEWEERAKYIEAWKPLDPHKPSELERYVQGMGIRMRGKLAKDFGLFKEAYFPLKLFIEQYAKRGSREEGWAIGDLGQAVLELEGTDEDCDAVGDFMKNGINCGQGQLIPELDARPCEVITQIYSQAIESRMITRGSSSQIGRRLTRCDHLLN
ncbi:hypothetical protein TESG_08523 [Trichophyton tonsurans CBS 112818]|uniref:Uncharacterized protein n=1 Tax=Trichophyton tonsurans (strain CBS 112818) TaxID=647933 RepID=F2S2U9_TRIT1|nr:hypothetical protein TESG_08523 [Trichophyton tonsurans CBS 112818]